MHKVREVMLIVLMDWHCRPACVMVLLVHRQMEVAGRLHVNSIDCLVTAVSLVLHPSHRQDSAT